MIGKVGRKLKFLFLHTTLGSFDQFRKIKPFDRLDQAIIEKNKATLLPYFQKYIKEISRADMAASLELATFLYTACQLNGYKKLLDTGSGLSSFVFRFYAQQNPGVTVWSVDDDVAWLNKTRTFLEGQGLGVQNIFVLNEFLALNESGFDCILHDLNFVEVRVNYVDQIIAMARPGGLVIFDDVHKPDYRFEVLEKLRRQKASVFSLRPVTLDVFGRFSLAALKGK